MYNNVTDIFKTTIRSPSRTFKGRLKINGKWINAGLKKMSYETSSTSEEALQLGAAVSARIELTIKKIDELFDNTEIPVEIGLKLPGGNYEYVPLGFFTAEHPKTDSNSTTFTAYDRMMKTTGVFISELIYPANAAAVMNEISSGCGVPCDTTGLDGITIETKPLGYTYREMIGYIASLAGKFASIDRRNGMIVFRWYTDSDFTVNTSRLMSFEEDESDYHLDTLICNVDSSTSMTAGSGTLGITFDNPFMTQERLNAIYNEIKDFSYRGISFKTPGDIRLDPWDIVTVNYNGTEYKVPVMNIVMEYDGGLSMTVTSYGKTETESSTDFQGPNAKASERTYAELMLAKEMIAKKVDAEWVKANTVTAEEIISVKADINTIKNNYLQTIEADIKYATVENEKVINSQIENLKANYEKVSTLMFGSASGTTLTTEFSNSVVSMIGDAQIKSAMIDNIAANKITSGKIYTNLVEVLSQSGNLDISDNTILIKDDAETARVQIGKDASGDYNMYLWDSAGNIMFDALGLTEKGIQREIIRNDMVAQDANISAKKLDITSLFSEINGSSETIKSSRIYVDADGQTLDVSFKTMQTSVNTANTNAVNALNSVNNIQVGGRNLYYLHDMYIRQLHCVDSYSVNDGEITLVANGNDLYIGEVLAAGGKWGPEFGPLMDIEGASYVTINISNSLFNKNFYNFIDADKKALSIYTYWNISSGRITVPSGAKYLNLRVGYGAAVSGTTYKLRIKVEKGNKATDWTPAIEDTDNSIEKLTETVSAQGTQLTAVQGQVSSKIWQQDITTAVNELQIGGRNLIRAYYIQHFDNGTTDTSEYITSGKVVCQGNGVNTGFRFDSINCYEPLTQYVLSGYITVTSKSCNNIYVFNGKRHSFISFKIDGIAYSNPFDIARTDVINILNDGKPHFFELRYETNANMPADVDVSYTYIQLNKSNTTQINYEFEFLKLGKGNKATDWSPAPEDVNDDILALTTQYSTLEQTLTGFKVEVGATYATKESLTATNATLELKVSKTDTGQIISMINASADAINITAANGGVNISGGKFTLSSPYTTISADGSINCSNLTATGSLKSNGTAIGNDGNVYSMQGSLSGGELKIANLTNNSFFAVQGHGIFAKNSAGIETISIISNSETGVYDGLTITGQAGTEVEVLRDGIALWYQPNNQKYTKIGKGYVRICSNGTNYYGDCALSVIGGIKTDTLQTDSLRVNHSYMGKVGVALNRTPSNDISFSWDGAYLRIHIDDTVIATYQWSTDSWI